MWGSMHESKLMRSRYKKKVDPVGITHLERLRRQAINSALWSEYCRRGSLEPDVQFSSHPAQTTRGQVNFAVRESN